MLRTVMLLAIKIYTAKHFEEFFQRELENNFIILSTLLQGVWLINYLKTLFQNVSPTETNNLEYLENVLDVT
jgi:hypothetical protein